MSEDFIYALDVGTRKVMGIVARRAPGGVEVLACDVAEHPTRSVSAGEVRDVRAVAAMIRAQVQRLRERTGVTFTRAAIAVAGRDLRTNPGRGALTLPQPGPIEPEHVNRVLHEAVQDALSTLPRAASGLATHDCVGYAATRFLIDGDVIAEPLGHYAQRLEAEVLATTLPRRVLDGLTAALSQAGLEASTITLEPIAALQAAVPEDLRRFHLALVDIGAGTSDIVIVRDGEIRAFGMVPCAGDFVTEALADHSALDFFTAERAKRELSAGRTAHVSDVFDNPRVLTPEEVLPRLKPLVRELAARIAESVLALGGVPRLVLCVGGGSLTPGLQEALAQALGLTIDRVGRRRATAAGLDENFSGPQAATPLGIAMIAAAEKGLSLRRFRLDGRTLHALEVGQKLTVLDALVAAGAPAAQVHGRLGLSISYTINAALEAARGTCGTPARVLCGGSPIALDAALPSGAELTFVAAEPGKDASRTLSQALAAAGLERLIRVSGKSVTIHPLATVNGQPTDPDAPLPDRARIEWRQWPSLREILNWVGAPNGARPVIGDIPIDLDSTPDNGAVIEFASVEQRRKLTVTVNGEPVVIKRPEPRGFGSESPALLVDLLPNLGESLRPLAGRRLHISVDGNPAGYTTPLHDGAKIAILF